MLKAVSGNGSPSQSSLVEQIGIDRSTLAGIVRRLVQRGLLQRRRTRHDARICAVRLTVEGRAVLTSAGLAIEKTSKHLLVDVSGGDREALFNSLKRIIAAVRR